MSGASGAAALFRQCCALLQARDPAAARVLPALEAHLDDAPGWCDPDAEPGQQVVRDPVVGGDTRRVERREGELERLAAHREALRDRVPRGSSPVKFRPCQTAGNRMPTSW